MTEAHHRYIPFGDAFVETVNYSWGRMDTRLCPAAEVTPFTLGYIYAPGVDVQMALHESVERHRLLFPDVQIAEASGWAEPPLDGWCAELYLVATIQLQATAQHYIVDAIGVDMARLREKTKLRAEEIVKFYEGPNCTTAPNDSLLRDLTTLSQM